MRELLQLLDVRFVNLVGEHFIEYLVDFLAVENGFFVGNEFLNVGLRGFTSVVQNDGDLPFFHFNGVAGLIHKMREGHDWNAGTDEFEATSESAMGQPCLDGRMSEQLQLRNPWFDPEVGIFLGKLSVFEAPNDSAPNFFEAFENHLDAPIFPLGD